MAYAYPTTIQNFTSYAEYFNTVTDGWFWVLALFGFGAAIFAFLTANRFNSLPANLHATFFGMFLVALPMYSMEIITPYIMLLVMVGWALSAWFWKTQQ